VRRIEALEVDHGAHTSVLLSDKEDVADKTGGEEEPKEPPLWPLSRAELPLLCR
jgi:hypothetical protein